MDWVTETRKHLRKILPRYPKLFFKVFKGFTVDLLCKELEKTPVPFIGTILAKLVREAVESEKEGGPSLEDVLQRLQQMKVSDDSFRQGLDEFGQDMDRLETIISSVRNDTEIIRKRTEPKLVIRDPEYKPNYPQADNELLFSLMNIGGGVIKVPEINLLVEKWEPETNVNYTAIAAPPLILRLKVRLFPDTTLYPLLKLNDEPYRRFGANSEGAEDICVQMSSEKNARYAVRIRIPYRDQASEQDGELIYPALNEPAMLVSFPYAPGWDSRVTPENILERSVVLAKIINTFNRVRSILEESEPSESDAQLQNLDQRIRETGFDMGLAYIPYVLNRFIPPLAQMIKDENQISSLKIVLELAHQSMRYLDISGSFVQFEPFSIDSLCNLVDRSEVADNVRAFFGQKDEQSRQKILAEILETI